MVLRDIPLKYPLKCFLTLWPWPLTYILDLNILPLDLHAKIQVRMSVCLAVRVVTDRQTHTHRQTMSKLLHPTCHRRGRKSILQQTLKCGKVKAKMWLLQEIQENQSFALFFHWKVSSVRDEVKTTWKFHLPPPSPLSLQINFHPRALMTVTNRKHANIIVFLYHLLGICMGIYSTYELLSLQTKSSDPLPPPYLYIVKIENFHPILTPSLRLVLVVIICEYKQINFTLLWDMNIFFSIPNTV